jgi:hypothetical protein
MSCVIEARCWAYDADGGARCRDVGAVESALPQVKGRRGRPMRDHRVLVEGAIYR